MLSKILKMRQEDEKILVEKNSPRKKSLGKFESAILLVDNDKNLDLISGGS